MRTTSALLAALLAAAHAWVLPSAAPRRAPPRTVSRAAASDGALARADALLASFDKAQRLAAAEGQRGLGGGLSANDYGAAYPDKAGLAAAVRDLVASSDRVMLGFCGSTAAVGIQALSSWVSALDLPRGKLHGMDDNGVAVEMDGAVYIKYNSQPVELAADGSTQDASATAGDANLKGYDGDFRGVYLTPQLPDGEFRQYAVLPLGLFRKDQAAPAPPPAVVMYGADWCGDCLRAKDVLARLNVAFEYDTAGNGREQAMKVSGRQNIPVVVFPDGSHLTEPSNLELAQKCKDCGLV